MINETSNLLYCEFITHFIEYYDLSNDPHQLINNKDLDEDTHNALHAELAQLRKCKGAVNCTVKRTATQQLYPDNSDDDEQGIKTESFQLMNSADVLSPGSVVDFIDELNEASPQARPQNGLDVFGRPEGRRSGKPRNKPNWGRGRQMGYRVNRRAKPRQVRRAQNSLKPSRPRKNKRQNFYM